jgi:hypothetical protein
MKIPKFGFIFGVFALLLLLIILIYNNESINRFISKFNLTTQSYTENLTTPSSKRKRSGNNKQSSVHKPKN